MGKTYHVYLVQEMIMNPDPKYHGYIAGRIEVWDNNSPFNIDEFRVFTNKGKEFSEYLDEIENETFTSIKQIREIEKRITKDFYKLPED